MTATTSPLLCILDLRLAVRNPTPQMLKMLQIGVSQSNFLCARKCFIPSRSIRGHMIAQVNKSIYLTHFSPLQEQPSTLSQSNPATAFRISNVESMAQIYILYQSVDRENHATYLGLHSVAHHRPQVLSLRKYQSKGISITISMKWLKRKCETRQQ